MCLFRLLTLPTISSGFAAAIHLAFNHPFALIRVIHFQEKIVLHRYDYIFDDYDFTQCGGRADLLFLLISLQTLDLINYIQNIDLPTDKL